MDECFKKYTVKPQYNVSLETTNFQRFIEINDILREIYTEAYGEGPNNLNVISKENFI
jgi:hypothetical protein